MVFSGIWNSFLFYIYIDIFIELYFNEFLVIIINENDINKMIVFKRDILIDILWMFVLFFWSIFIKLY